MRDPFIISPNYGSEQGIHNSKEVMDYPLIYHVQSIMDGKRWEQVLFIIRGVLLIIIDERSIYNIPGIMDCTRRVKQSIMRGIL